MDVKCRRYLDAQLRGRGCQVEQGNAENDISVNNRFLDFFFAKLICLKSPILFFFPRSFLNFMLQAEVSNRNNV